jgi:hypothetical protein
MAVVVIVVVVIVIIMIVVLIVVVVIIVILIVVVMVVSQYLQRFTCISVATGFQSFWISVNYGKFSIVSAGAFRITLYGRRSAAHRTFGWDV